MTVQEIPYNVWERFRYFRQHETDRRKTVYNKDKFAHVLIANKYLEDNTKDEVVPYVAESYKFYRMDAATTIITGKSMAENTNILMNRVDADNIAKMISLADRYGYNVTKKVINE